MYDRMVAFDGMTRDEAREFASRWLPAWTGGDAGRLLALYTDDAVYSDPVVPGGVSGAALREYLTKLLVRNPDWVWTQTDSIPIEGGFLNVWHARVPRPDGESEWTGVCTCRVRDGLIYENRVYMERGPGS